jgi:acetyl-CoA carboxylase carboxyltransferase component
MSGIDVDSDQLHPTHEAARAAMLERVVELRKRRAEALAMGGPERIARHHESGRLTARERIDLLIDAGSWHELGMLALPDTRPDGPGGADGLITGWARVRGRRVAVMAVDATVLGGTTARVNATKLMRLFKAAGRSGFPIIVLADADGGRMPDLMGWRFGGLPLAFDAFLATPEGRPTVLRLCAALGPCFGDAGLEASTAHFAVMTPNASIALSGTEVVATATGEQLTNIELGGPDVAINVAGSVEMLAQTEHQAIAAVRRALTYLPDNASQEAPLAPPMAPSRPAEDLLHLLPVERKQGYDMRPVLDAIVDAESILEYGAPKGPGLICAFARIEGMAVGLAASQPLRHGGALDVPALQKWLAFIDVCDTFNLPLVMLHDVPGLLIGSNEERLGLIRYLERVALRISQAEVPKVAVILRKSYGGGYFVLAGKQSSPDLLVAWPTAELGFMAPEAGVRTVHRRDLEAARAGGGNEAYESKLAELIEEWAHESEPWEAAAHYYLDDIIDPRETRSCIVAGIEYTWGQRRVSKHGCAP